jgi:hypothetical protein
MTTDCANADELDETAYLLSSDANRRSLLEAVTDIDAGRNLVEPALSVFQ